jgi:hypothetical protein
VLNTVIKYLIFLVILPSVIFAQSGTSIKSNFAHEPGTPHNSPSELTPMSKISLTKKTDVKKSEESIPLIFYEKHPVEFFQKNNKAETSFNIVSSFRNNIRFGGFWGEYAIVNFTPSMQLQPFDFISVYANHNFSCFVPIKGIKEHMEMLCIQGAAVLAVDNSVKLIFGTRKMLPSIASFIAKTIIINSLMASINKNKKNKILDYRSYYYAFSIRL